MILTVRIGESILARLEDGAGAGPTDLSVNIAETDVRVIVSTVKGEKLADTAATLRIEPAPVPGSPFATLTLAKV